MIQFFIGDLSSCQVIYAPFQGNFAVAHPVFYEKMPYPDMFCPLSAGLFAVCFDQHGAHVVLI
jgi:hypothetical protein